MDLDALLTADEAPAEAPAPRPHGAPIGEDSPESIYIDVPTGDIFFLNEKGYFEGLNGRGYDYVEGIEKHNLKLAYDSCDDEAVAAIVAEAQTYNVDAELYARWRRDGIEDLNWYQVSKAWEWLAGFKRAAAVKSEAAAPKVTAPSIEEMKQRSAEQIKRVAESRAARNAEHEAKEAPAAESKAIEPEIVHESPAVITDSEDAAAEAAEALGCTRDEALTFSVKDHKSSEWFKARVIFWQTVVDQTVKMACLIVKGAVAKRNRLLAAYGPQHKHYLLTAKNEDGTDLMERFSRGEKKGQLKVKNHRTLTGGTYFKKAGGVFRADSHELALDVQKLPEWSEAEELAAKCKAVGINVTLAPALKFWNDKAKAIAKENDAIIAANAEKQPNERKEALKPLPAGYQSAPIDETRFMTIGIESGWTLKKALEPLRQMVHIQDAPIAGNISEDKDDDNGED